MIGEREATAQERFYADLERDSLQGLWRVQTQTPEPRTAAQPYLWRWETLRGDLARAGEVMTMDRSAERRVLLLVNPGLRAINAATHTLTAAVQMIKPGEIAPTHRHSPTAIHRAARPSVAPASASARARAPAGSRPPGPCRTAVARPPRPRARQSSLPPIRARAPRRPPTALLG